METSRSACTTEVMANTVSSRRSAQQRQQQELLIKEKLQELNSKRRGGNEAGTVSSQERGRQDLKARFLHRRRRQQSTITTADTTTTKKSTKQKYWNKKKKKEEQQQQQQQQQQEPQDRSGGVHVVTNFDEKKKLRPSIILSRLRGVVTTKDGTNDTKEKDKQLVPASSILDRVKVVNCDETKKKVKKKKTNTSKHRTDDDDSLLRPIGDLVVLHSGQNSNISQMNTESYSNTSNSSPTSIEQHNEDDTIGIEQEFVEDRHNNPYQCDAAGSLFTFDLVPSISEDTEEENRISEDRCATVSLLNFSTSIRIHCSQGYPNRYM